MSSAAPALNGWGIEEALEAQREAPWEIAQLDDDALLDAEIERAGQMVSDEVEEEVPYIATKAFERASDFLRAQSQASREKFGCFPPVPNISPGPDGSVDLHWEQSDWGLLVNVPPSDAPATFYGDGKGMRRIKGGFDPTNCNLGIIAWLSKN